MLDGMGDNEGRPDDYLTDKNKLIKFINYSPIDPASLRSSSSTTPSDGLYATDCTCEHWGHAFNTVKDKFSVGDLRQKAYELCKNSGYTWGGLIFKLKRGSNDYRAVEGTNMNTFTIVKMAYGDQAGDSCKRVSGNTNKISVNICSPYDRNENHCDNKTDQCTSSECQIIGKFYDKDPNDETEDRYCPNVCEDIEEFNNIGNTTTVTTVDTTNFDVVSRIDYYDYRNRNSNPRKSSNIDDQDNSIYYRVNDGREIKVNETITATDGSTTEIKYLPIKEGLLAIGGPDIVGITCNNAQIPKLNDEDLFTATSTFTEADGDFSGCKVKGKYTSIETQITLPDGSKTGDVSTHLYYNEQKQGILPIKWSTFTAHKGDKLPLSITSANGGASPLLVKTNNCLANPNNQNCYTQLTNGNGLIIVLEPITSGSSTPAVDEDMYKNPNLWLCHYGVGGSYGSYIPYLYKENSVTGIGIDNPRKIHTDTSLSWRCDSKKVAYWFTGYDYKGIKLKTQEENSDYIDTLIDNNSDDAYPSPHVYKLSEINRVIPDYGREDLEDQNENSVAKIDCGADGTPSEIKVGGLSYTKASNQLSLGKLGTENVYNYYVGSTLEHTPVSGVDSLTYPAEMPNRLFIKTTETDAVTNETKDKQALIEKNTNNLTRAPCSEDDNIHYCYFYDIIYTGASAQDEIHNLTNCKCEDSGRSEKCNDGVNRICSYKISVYDDSILGAYCSDDNSDPTTDVSKSLIVTSVTTDSCGESCKIIDNTANEKEIFTAYGPFAGMNADNVNAVMPAIYDGYHACRGSSNKKQFIYDTQEGPNGNMIYNYLTLGLVDLTTGVPRKPLDVYWRLEFTNPTLENKSSYKGSYNSVDTTCPAGDKITPDIMFVDLTNTNEWSSYAGGRRYPQTVLIYRDINGLIKKPKVYYKITYNHWGWVNKQLPEDDHRILAIGETCGLHENCGDDEVPDLKILNNEEIKTLVDKDKYSSIPEDSQATIASITNVTYEFYYNGIKYTISEDKVAATTKICNIADQQAWLSSLTTVGEKMALDSNDDPLGNLGRAPFIIACDNNEGVKEKYKYGYTSLSNLSSGISNMSNVASLHTNITDGAPSGEGVEHAFVMKTQNSSFLSSPYFARCTTNWQTPGWMLLNNPGDFSSFNVTDNALSGSFIAPPNKSLTWEEIKTKYSLEHIWAKHGGIVRNVLYNNECTSKDVPTITTDRCGPNNCGKMHTECTTTSHEQHTPEFTTLYKTQMIAFKTLANDPINTTDTDCEIVVKESGNELGKVTIKANEPFGQVLPRSAIQGITFQGDVSGVRNSLYENTAITANGGLQYKRNFFKKTEFYRNLIGAGIVRPEWHFLTDTTSNTPVVIEQNKRIKIEPSDATFYAMGNLSHKGQAYCLPETEDALASSAFYIGLAGIPTGCIAAAAATLGTTAAGTAMCIAGGTESAIAAFVAGMKAASEHSGSMSPISRGNTSKRYCGTGMAFRVVEVPTFACIKGYGFGCTGERLNKQFERDTNKDKQILQNCISSTSTDYASKITVGTCHRHKINILSGEQADTKALAYTQRYHLNSFKELPMSIEHNPWSEIENIDEQHCGICLPRNEIEKYNGISYYTGNNYPAIPNNVKNISQCNSYQDNEGNKYTFVTSLARITPFHKYDLSKQTEIQNHINTILLTEIRSCTSETTSSYSINFSNQTNKDAFENIFQKMSIRNENSCIALLETFYSHELKQAKVSEECENAIISNISNIAKNGCQKLLEYIENKDSKYYDLYDFNVNQTYTECQDDKDIINASSSPIISIARVNVTNSLKDYGFAELTNNISNSISADGVFEINVDMPDKIKINGVEQEYDKANVGFAIAGAKTTDPMSMYSNFKLDDPADISRGYSIRIGNGIVSRNGKYLYYYIQPNDANGNPDPLFEPNTHFNLHAANPHGKLYVKNLPIDESEVTNDMIEILKDTTIHHFQEEDVDGDGNITFTAPDSGTLWFAVLDVDEKDPETHDSISNERDGKAIIFRDALDLSVNNEKKNVLGTNGGYYMVKGKIQGETFDIMGDMLSLDGSKFMNRVHNEFFQTVIIKPVRKLLFGSSDFKNLTYENILSKKADRYEEIFNRYDGMSKAEKSRLTKEQEAEQAEATKIHNLNKDLRTGLIFQLLKIFFSFHLVHVLYYIAVVGCMFVFGGKVLLGMQKIDFKTIFKYVLRFSLIALVLHPDALKLYLIVFVKTAFALSDGFIMMVASNFTDRVYTADDSSTALSVAFGPVDSVIEFWLKSERIEQLLAILCSSWFGWVSVLILLLGTIHFMLSAIQALIVYLLTLMNLFLELALGPIYFALLLYDKTASKFTQWLKNIGALIAQQTAMFSALAIFATIYYHILKGTLNFTYCWEPIIKVPVLNIPLFSCWRIAGNLPVAMAEMMGDFAPTGKAITGSTGFSPLTALCLYLLTVTMSKFIDKSVKFGGDLFGGGSQMAQGVSEVFGKAKDITNVAAGHIAKNVPKKIVSSFGKAAKAPIDQAAGIIQRKMQ